MADQVNVDEEILGILVQPVDGLYPSEMFPVPTQKQGLARMVLHYVPVTATQHLPNSWAAIYHRAGKGMITVWAKGGHPVTIVNLIGLCDELERHFLGMAERHQIPMAVV